MTLVPELLECFLSLPDENLGNLAYHLGRGTPILCGDDADLWTEGPRRWAIYFNNGWTFQFRNTIWTPY